MVKVREERERGMDQQRGSRRRLGARAGWVSALSLGRSTCAQGLGVACALWVSTGWAQEPANPEPAPEAAPPAAEPTTPAADAPVGDTEPGAADALPAEHSQALAAAAAGQPNEKYRLIFLLASEGMDTASIAKHTNLTRGEVEMLLDLRRQGKI